MQVFRVQYRQNILFVQYGNFAEVFHHLGGGGEENYRDQKKSVDFVTSLLDNSTVVSLSCTHDEEQLRPGLTAVGVSVLELTKKRVRFLFDRYKPDLVILRTPHLAVLQEAARRKIPIMPCFADLFSGGRLRSRWHNWKLTRALMSTSVSCVGNHNLIASLSLVQVLGIKKNNVIPWDWSRIPCEVVSKTEPRHLSAPTAFFAGAITADKGIGDCLQAVAELKQRGLSLRFSFAGEGNLNVWQNLAAKLDITDQVVWLGSIPNAQVRTLMRTHDIIVVPSRHSYAEGLPNTIYEALASRSPLLISDHPAFKGRVKDDACLIFKANNAVDMAEMIQMLLQEPSRYASMSLASKAALESLYLGLEWPDLMTKWLRDPRNESQWVERYSLEAMGL